MEVVWQPKATKQLLRIGDRKLRTRIGNWRVFFDIIDVTPAIISIEEVKKRDERTY